MNLFFSEAKKFVRARLDELSLQDPLLQGEVIDDANLDQLISELIEEAVTYVHEMAPASLMEGPLLTQDDLKDHWSVLNGVLDVDLSGISQDALRVISFKAGDSDVKLTRMVYEDSPVGRMQHNRYVQGRPDNPVLVMLDDSPNYHPHLRYYTTDLTPEDLTFALRFFPLPRRQTYSISLNQSLMTFVGNGGSKSLSVFTEKPWKVEGCPAWLLMPELSGEGNKQVTITATENGTGAERSATLRFITDEGTATLEVVQKIKQSFDPTFPIQPGSKFLAVACDRTEANVVTLPLLSAGNNIAFRVSASSGLAWNVTLDGKGPAAGLTSVQNDWLVVSPASGTGTGAEDYRTVTMTVRSINDTNAPREAEIKFSADGVKSVIYKVRQDNILSVIPSEDPIPAEGGYTTAQIIAKLPWSIEAEDSEVGNFRIDPLSGNAGTTVVRLYADENERAERFFNYTVKAGPVALDVQVIQTGADGPVDKPHDRIQFSPSLLSFTAEGDCDEGVDVNGYVNVAFNIPPAEYSLDFAAIPAWLHVMADDHGFRVRVDLNIGTEKRAYNIEVWLTDDPEVKGYLLVEQEGMKEEEEPADKWAITFVDGSTPGGADILRAEANASYANCEVWVYCNGKRVLNEPVAYQTGASWLLKYASRNPSQRSWEATDPNLWLSIVGTSTATRKTTLTASLKNHPEVTETLIIEQLGTAASDKRFTMAPASRTLEAEATESKLSVSSNESWILTISGDAKFHSNGQKSLQGSGDLSDIEVDITPNASTTSNKTITISGQSGSGITGAVVFTMNKKEETKVTPSITLDDNAASIGAEGGLLTVTLDSNVPWKVVYGGSGLTFSPSEGPAGSGQEIDITVAANNSTSERVMTPHFRTLDLLYGESFTITQAAKEEEDNESISLSKSSVTLHFGGADTVDVGVNATSQWKLVSKPSWLTVTAAGASVPAGSVQTAAGITLKASANISGQRSGNVVVALVNDNSKTATLTVKQEANPSSILAISPNTTSRNTGTITVTADRKWKINSCDPGLVITPSSGTGNATLTFTAEINPYATARSLSATFVTEDGARASTFTANQSAGVFRISTTAVEFGPDGGSSEALLYSSASWKVTDKPSWLTVTPTSGQASTGSVAVALTAPSFMGTTAREGNVILRNDITGAVVSVKITQQPVAEEAPYITTSPDRVLTIAEGERSGNVTVVSNRDWTARYEGGLPATASGRAGVPVLITLTPVDVSGAVESRSYLTIEAGTISKTVMVIKKNEVLDETIDLPENNIDEGEFIPGLGPGEGNGGSGGGGTDPDVPEDGGPTEPGLDEENGEIGGEQGGKNV